jgi:hypothetical protein
VRSDLATLEGVSDVRTDLGSRTCQFKLAKSDLDLEAKLTELAKGNEHFVGFEIIKK